MNEHAVFTFIGNSGIEYHVYKDKDGYPWQAIRIIIKSLALWNSIGAFTALDYATSFINEYSENLCRDEQFDIIAKHKDYDIYLTSHWNNHLNLYYRYEISQINCQIWVRGFEIDMDNESTWREIFFDNLHNLIEINGYEFKLGDKCFGDLKSRRTSWS